MGHRLPIRQVSRLLDAGLVTSEQLASFCYALAVAGEDVWGLNAYNTLAVRDDLFDLAKESDSRRKHGRQLSVFDGIPISVKANIAVAEHPLTAGSAVLGLGAANVPGCGYDSDVARILLRDCGALLIGSTNMDEFGMGSLGNNTRFPDGSPRFTKNPLPLLRKLVLSESSDNMASDEKLVNLIRLPQDAIIEKHYQAMDDSLGIYSAGGSSSGSAASVAHGSAFLSLGTDTGGSVRLPSAWCGLVGLKPTYGLLSRHGIVSYASSFDTVGILANSAECVHTALAELAHKHDASRDSTFSTYAQLATPSSDTPSEKEEVNSSGSLDGLTVGIPAAFSVEECPEIIRGAWSRAAELLEQSGASVREISTGEVSPELVQKALAAYYVLVSAEASSNLSRYDGFRYGISLGKGTTDAGASDLTPLERQYAAARTEGFGTEVSRRILCGTSVLSSDRFHTYYEAAAKLRAALALQLCTVLEGDVDVILTPTALSLPRRLDEGAVDSTEMLGSDVMTVPASLAGLPTLSVPIDTPEGADFPAGMQLIGQRLQEDVLLQVGEVLGKHNSKQLAV